MSDSTDPEFRDVYRFRVSRETPIRVERIPGNDTPAKLSVTLPSQPQIERALVNPTHGAILALDMEVESAVDLLHEILGFLRGIGYRLPDLSVPPASFPGGVDAGPNSGRKK